MFVLCVSVDVLRKGYDGKMVVTKPVGSPYGAPGSARCVTPFDTERGAKISCAALNKRMVKRWNKDKADKYGNAGTKPVVYMVMPFAEWTAKYNPTVTRKNMMSGNDFQEPYYTEGYMSPASESYWSM